tara:strand:- start:1462 stop:1929 length:468 start_codon:yes stop_codon:yes gene_type:complete
MINLPISIIIKIHNFIGPKVLYFGKNYFDEINKLKNTFKNNPVKFSFDKGVSYFRRSPHWPSRVRLDNDYYKRKVYRVLKGYEYIGQNLWHAKKILKKKVSKKIERPSYKQHPPYPFSEEIYTVTEINGYNFNLESAKDRLNLYQILWGKYNNYK